MRPGGQVKQDRNRRTRIVKATEIRSTVMNNRSATWLMAILLATAFGIGAQSSDRTSEIALLNRAVATLTEEAEAAREKEALPRRGSDFARDFRRLHGGAVPGGRVVWSRMRRPLSRDPFIDAYVRWQLLGFNPELPEASALDDRAFERFLADLPALLKNPRSDRRLLAQVNRALAREELNESDARAMSDLDRDLRKRTRLVNELNRPALELRRWVERQAGATGHRIHQVRLERLAAMVVAGWNVEGLKRQIAQGFNDAKRDYSFTLEERQRVAGQARKLIGLRTKFVTRIGAADGAPQAEFDEGAVYDFEVESWVRALLERGD